MEFVPDPIARRNLRMKAEEMARKLVQGQFACAPHTHVHFQSQSIDVDVLTPISQDNRSGNGPKPNPPLLCISSRKRAFNYLDFADTESSTQVDLDEISVYNEINVGTIK